jgi:hypothetical protein
MSPFNSRSLVAVPPQTGTVNRGWRSQVRKYLEVVCAVRHVHGDCARHITEGMWDD